MREYIITLVHGTFAQNAPWTKPQSVFCKSLCSQLGAGVRLVPFCWTGRNSHHARLVAGQQLADHIERLAAQYPGTDQFIIGHSHGGNVAIYATGLTKPPPSLRGVICLATPFIHARPRSQDFFWAMLGPACLALLVIGVIIGSKIEEWLYVPESFRGGPTAAMAPLFLFPLLYYVYRIGSTLDNYASSRASLVTSSPTRSWLPVVSLRLKWDEAKFWLETLLFFVGLPERVRFLITWLAGNGFKFVSSYWGVGVIAGSINLMVLLIFLLGEQRVEALGWWVLWVVLSLVFVPLIACLIVIPVAGFTWIAGVIGRGTVVGLGEALLDSLTLHTTVHDQDTHIFVPAQPHTTFARLRHSQICEQREIIDVVAEWIRSHSKICGKARHALPQTDSS